MRKHLYLYACALTLFTACCIYVYISDHRRYIHKNKFNSNNKFDDKWYTLFRNSGLTDKQINFVSHDNDIWYYKGENTCIAYGEDLNKECDHTLSVCMGGSIPFTTIGERSQQAFAVSQYIKGNKNIIDKCPIIYSGHS